MSWYITIKCDKEIQKTDVQDIVDNMPEYLSVPTIRAQQDWGWLCQTDIFNPERDQLKLHGAYGTEHRNMFEYIIISLCKKGYKIVYVDESF